MLHTIFRKIFHYDGIQFFMERIILRIINLKSFKNCTHLLQNIRNYSIKNTCFNVSVHFSKYWCFDCLKTLKYSEHVFFLLQEKCGNNICKLLKNRYRFN